MSALVHSKPIEMGIFSMIKEAFTGSTVDYMSLIDQGAIVIDVRTKEEFRSGHAKKSINIPLHTLGGELDILRGKVVIMVCRSGARSGQATKVLKGQGIEAYNAGAWQNVA